LLAKFFLHTHASPYVALMSPDSGMYNLMLPKLSVTTDYR